MSATALGSGRVRIRFRPWNGLADTSEITVVPFGAAPPQSLMISAIEGARRAGTHRLVTPALTRHEWQPFLDLGFEIQEELHLLVHPLLGLPDRSAHPLRRGLRRDHRRVLEVDREAFNEFWHMDDGRLRDALDATPATRFRVDRSATPSAYSIIGRAADRGYVQRLAVHPSAQGRGLGSALVIDGLHWLRRWRVREAFVNTQIGNDTALALYEKLGFRRRNDGLAVFGLDLRP